jgi:hypothetical protein
MDPQRGNVRIIVLTQMIWLILVVYSSRDGIAFDRSREYKSMVTYGCPECHSNALSCHVDWQRSKIDQIMKLWNKSFHLTLMKDTFSACFSFSKEGRCAECHPGLMKPVKVDYKKIYGDSLQ